MIFHFDYTVEPRFFILLAVPLLRNCMSDRKRCITANARSVKQFRKFFFFALSSSIPTELHE